MAIAESLMPTISLIKAIEHHSIVSFSGFETSDFSEWASTTGAPAIDDGTLLAPHTGDYHMRCNPTDDSYYATVGITNPYRISCYLYIATMPDTRTIIAGSPTTLNIRIAYATFELSLYDGNTLRDTGTVLQTGQQYRISASVDASNNARIYLNGVLDCTFDGCTLGDFDDVLGIRSDSTADLYYDDYVADNTQSTDDLGDIRVLRASPNAAGQYAEFDTISGYTHCDEVPASDVDYVDDSGVSVIHRETYNLQDAATIGVGASDTWKAVNVWMRGYDSGNSAQGITVRDNSVDYETLAEFGKAFTWKNKLYDTNAPRASAWTTAIFNAFQSGGYSEGSKDVWMSCVMVMVAFIPVGVTDYPISLSPGLTASATVAYAVAWDRGMSPGLTATITIARALAYDRGTSPGLTVSATIAKSLGRLITTTANLTVSSAVARFMSYTRATPSNLTASVTVAKSFGKKIATTANLVVSTTIAMSKGFVRAVASNLTASTTVDRTVAYKRTSTPSLTASATVDRDVTYTRATQPALSVAVSIVRAFGKTITTATGLTVSATVLKSWGRTITTTAGLTISTTISRVVAYHRAISAGIDISVVVTAVKAVGTRLTRAWGIIFG